MNRKKAVAMSVEKWTALSRGKSPSNYNCGFCEYFCIEEEHDQTQESS